MDDVKGDGRSREETENLPRVASAVRGAVDGLSAAVAPESEA